MQLQHLRAQRVSKRVRADIVHHVRDRRSGQRDGGEI